MNNTQNDERADVRSTDWLGELEAALRHAENLKSISARENYWQTNYSRWADGVMVYSEIEKAIARERSRSPNDGDKLRTNNL